MAKKVADQLVDTLEKAGVRRIYAVTGDSLNEVNEAVRKNGRLRWIHVRHEETGAYAAAAGFCGIVHFEEFQDAGACVVDLDERRRKRLRGFERAVDQHDRRSGSVNIGFVFGIGKIAERAGLAFLDRRYGVYFRLFVADDFTAQESGDHFGCEFHHKIIIGIC